MIFEINEKHSEPIYRQIQQQIILAIAENKIAPGDNLPSIRQLSDELSINPMTISKAYGLLKEQGYLLTDRRNGTVIQQPTPFNAYEKSNYLNNLALILAEGYLHQEESQDILTDVEELLQKYESQRKIE